jgi:hypothetical protein
MYLFSAKSRTVLTPSACLRASASLLDRPNAANRGVGQLLEVRPFGLLVGGPLGPGRVDYRRLPQHIGVVGMRVPRRIAALVGGWPEAVDRSGPSQHVALESAGETTSVRPTIGSLASGRWGSALAASAGAGACGRAAARGRH